MPNLKLSCADFVLELTRRCNMKCAHCLRGPAEPLDMPEQLLENAMSQVSEVTTLTFTGGEPALVPHLIQKALDLAEKYKVRVSEVYIATNGKSVPDEFLDACRAWNQYCVACGAGSLETYTGGSDAYRILKIINNRDIGPSGCYVDLSLDAYHEDIPTKNLLKLTSLPHIGTGKYHHENENDKWLLGVGQAAWNGLALEEEAQQDRPWAYGDAAYHLDAELDGKRQDLLRTDGMIYINAEGTILKYCDYPYRDQDEYALGSIKTGNPDPEWVSRLWSQHCPDENQKQENIAMAASEKIYEVKFPGEAAQYLRFWHSDNPAATENCDACISYSLYDPMTQVETDGGEMDFDSNAKNYDDLNDALNDLIDFIWDGATPASCVSADIDPAELDEYN